jgi:hypothetical protein
MAEEDLGFAQVDLGRRERCGRAEVIYCPGKLPEEVAEIAGRLRSEGEVVLATRATAEQAAAVRERLPEAVFHERAGCVTCGEAVAAGSCWAVGILTAGTADLAVAEEAAVTLGAFGQRVERFTDVGVAGLHRLLGRIEAVRACGVLIVVAGMEGALPSVVAGLVDMPVIAVPTSVGYGANLGGVTALLGMLTSCGSKVTVVNIDNGFGAASSADAILRLAGRTQADVANEC